MEHHNGQQRKNHPKKSRSKLEGLEIAVCRHGILVTALNMFCGEIFAYPLFLQKKLAEKSQGTIQFFCSDVACKYFPYLQRVSKNCPELVFTGHASFSFCNACQSTLLEM